MSRRPCNRELNEPLYKQYGPIHGPLEGEDDSSDVASAAEDDAPLLGKVDTAGVVDERLASGLRTVSPETSALCTADLSLGHAPHGPSEGENNSSEVESEMEGDKSFQNNDDHQNVVDEQLHSGPQIASSVFSSGQVLRFAGPLSTAGPASSAGPRSSAPSQNSVGPLASAGLSSSTNLRHRIDSETGASCPPRDGCDVARRTTVIWTRRVSEPAANRDGRRFQASQDESPQLHVTRRLERRPPLRRSFMRPFWADRPASRSRSRTWKCSRRVQKTCRPASPIWF